VKRGKTLPDMCFVPIATGSGAAQVAAARVLYALDCDDMKEEFGRAALDGGTPVSCTVTGPWDRLEKSRHYNGELAARYAKMKRPLLVLADTAGDWTAVALTVLLMGGAFAAARRLSLARRA
jgi:hypothetical protein